MINGHTGEKSFADSCISRAEQAQELLYSIANNARNPDHDRIISNTILDTIELAHRLKRAISVLKSAENFLVKVNASNGVLTKFAAELELIP